MSVSIVVPIYNEQECVERLYEALKPVVDDLDRPAEIVLVDDGSTDRTPKLLEQLAASDSRVKIVEFRKNFGQTAAMAAGIQHSSGEIIVTMDADLQNDPRDIPRLIAKIDEGHDLVHGWRRDRHDALWTRKIPSRIANRLISRVTGVEVHDLGCTLKAIKREIAVDLELFGDMHRFIPILAYWRGAKCHEIETTHHPRRYGQSKYGLSRTFRVLLDLITVKYLVQYLVSPMRLFGGMGLMCAVVCGLSGAATLAMKLLGGIDMTGNPLLLLTAISSIAAIQFFVLGMLGELGARIYFEVRQRQPYSVRRTVNLDRDSGEDRPAAAWPRAA